MTYLRINLKTVGLYVNLGPAVLRHLKGEVGFCPKTGLKTFVVNVM